MSNNSTKPKCPRCGRPGVAVSGDMFRCPVGCGFFDSDPNEGGYATHDNPERAAESKEEYQQREAQRRRDRQARGGRFNKR